LFAAGSELRSEDSGESGTEKVDASAAVKNVDDSAAGSGDASDQKSKDKVLAALETVKNNRIRKRRPVRVGGSSAAKSGAEEFFVIAKVGDEVITNVDVINSIRFIFFSSGMTFNESDAKPFVLPVVRRMIEDKYLQFYAKFFRVGIRDKDVDNKLKEIADGNSLTIEGLDEKFNNSGISLDIFKKNIRPRMLLGVVVHMTKNLIPISVDDLKEEKLRCENEARETRYHIAEIFFRVDDKKNRDSIRRSAESMLDLMKKGFSFSVIAEVVSQGISEKQGDVGWSTGKSLEPQVLRAISTMSPGRVSDVIETDAGFKIVYLIDKAAPGKSGERHKVYNVASVTMKYSDPLSMQKDQEEKNKRIEDLLSSKSGDEFKAKCSKYKLVAEDKAIASPVGFEKELIERSVQSGKPAVLQSQSDEKDIVILMVTGATVPDATVPAGEELADKVQYKKIKDEFYRNFKRVRAMLHSELYTGSLSSVIR
jgi:parvulin-like peptidyl-prolyl isomerase